MWLCTIREIECAKHAIKEGLIKVGEVYKSRLHTSSSSRLIDTIYYLLEILMYLLSYCLLPDTMVCYLHIRIEIILITPFLSCKVIKVNQELRCSYCPSELRSNSKDEIDIHTAETIKILGAGR